MAAALAFLLLYEWFVYKVPVTQIYLPASSWSDDGRLQQAACRCGAGRRAPGVLPASTNPTRRSAPSAAWGPAVFWVYAVPGFFLRGQNAFVWCNLLFAVAGWLVFARAARLKVWQQAAFAAVLACLNVPIRYIFSAMQEPLHYALVLAVTGTAVLVRRSEHAARPGRRWGCCAPWPRWYAL